MLSVAICFSVGEQWSGKLCAYAEKCFVALADEMFFQFYVRGVAFGKHGTCHVFFRQCQQLLCGALRIGRNRQRQLE